MQKHNHRQVLFFDAYFSSYAGRIKGLVPKHPSELAKYIINLHARVPLRSINKSSTHTLYLADVSLHNGSLVLLINSSDKDAADPTFTDPAKGSRRVVKKRIGEGADHSSHAILLLKEQKKGSNAFPFLLEVAPGFSSYRVKSFINYILKQCVLAYGDNFLISHPDGSVDKNGEPRKILSRHRIDLRGHLSKSFERDLDGGVLSDIEIFTESEQDIPWDGRATTLQKRRSIYVTPNSSIVLPKNISLLREAFGVAVKQNYEQARVSFKTASKIPRTVRLYTDTMQLVDEKYVRREIIENFSVPLSSSYDKIYSPIVSKMLQLTI